MQACLSIQTVVFNTPNYPPPAMASSGPETNTTAPTGEQIARIVILTPKEVRETLAVSAADTALSAR